MTRSVLGGAAVAAMMVGGVYAQDGDVLRKQDRWIPGFDRRAPDYIFKPEYHVSNNRLYLEVVGLPGTEVVMCDLDEKLEQALRAYAQRLMPVAKQRPVMLAGEN